MDSIMQDLRSINIQSAMWVSVLAEVLAGEASPQFLSVFRQWAEQSDKHRGTFLQVFEDIVDNPVTFYPSCAGTDRCTRFLKNGANGLPDIDRWNALDARRRRMLRRRRSLRVRLYLLWSDVSDAIVHSKCHWVSRAMLRMLTSMRLESEIAHIERRFELIRSRPRLHVQTSQRQRLRERLLPYRKVVSADIPQAPNEIEATAFAFAIELRFRPNFEDKDYSTLNAWLDVDHRHMLAFVRSARNLHICLKHC